MDTPVAADLPDIASIPVDLTAPVGIDGEAKAGLRVRRTTADWEGTGVHHALYLPTNWRGDAKFPVIVEYAGNGGYANAFGDACAGTVEGSKLGYGLSTGADYIWLCLPFVQVNAEGRENAATWWGDADETARYCVATLRDVCRRFGGDERAVILCGFSRGAIACNYIGLRNEEIAKLWRGFLCHSHYDGVREWDYPGSDAASARRRLERLEGRPQFISDEAGTEATRRFIGSSGTSGTGAPFTFADFPFRNHTDA